MFAIDQDPFIWLVLLRQRFNMGYFIPPRGASCQRQAHELGPGDVRREIRLERLFNP
jgi:hypothetical protein